MKNATLMNKMTFSLLILLIVFSGTGIGQTVSYSCTSKDLYIRKAYFEGFNICNAPEDGTPFRLKLRIINKTNSTRNAAGYWATLYKISALTNEIVDTTYYHDTKGCNKTPALLPSDSTEFLLGDVNFEEGYQYLLNDVILAWTNASKNADSNTIENDFGSSVSPKCAYGESVEIPVNIVPNAEITDTATCLNGGKATITVTPTGGKPNYNILLKGDNKDTTYGSATGVLTKTFTDLSAGDYLVIVTDQTPCTDTQRVQIRIQGSLPPLPNAIEIEDTLKFCGSRNGSLKIVSPSDTVKYWVIKYNYDLDRDDTTEITDENGVVPIGAGEDPRFYYSNNVCNSPVTTYECSSPTFGGTTLSQKRTGTNNLGSGVLETPVTITTVPNPFSNRVRFVINVAEAGNGSLEIYNIQGQKLKTLYQGYMPAGTNFYELTMAHKRQGELIYVFTKDGVRTSGKLLQMSKY